MRISLKSPFILSSKIFLRLCLLALVTCFFLGQLLPVTQAAMQQTFSGTGVLKLDQAMLETSSGMAPVNLPHVLKDSDFAADGGTVRYWMNIDLPQVPQQPLALYIKKVSLAGQLYLNGEWIDACSVGALDNLRCHHRPWLVSTPKSLWQEGRNTLVIEVYADTRQTNGLTAIQIGPLIDIEQGEYTEQRFVRVTLIQALSWITFILGLLALMVTIYLPSQSLYLWVGLASLMHALSNINFLSTAAWPSTEVFSWFAFSSRMSSTPLLMMACIAFYRKDKPWQRKLALFYAIAAPLMMWISGNSRTVSVLFYVPILISSAVMLVAMTRWTWSSRSVMHTLMLLASVSMLIAGISDWQRLRGSSAFEGIYLMAYASSGFLIIMGGLVMAELATGLIKSRQLSAALERQVAEREALLQDMHDGFGSQLTSARIMAEQGQLDQEQVKDVLEECIADLYLIVDTLAGHGKPLELALGDFRFRTVRRTTGLPTQLHWDQRLENLPPLSDKTILQILRILQEAVANALKHSGAANLWIDVVYAADQNMLRLVVADDGTGMPVKLRHGRGLHNMQHRARELGATLHWADRNPGSLVVLEIPIVTS